MVEELLELCWVSRSDGIHGRMGRIGMNHTSGSSSGSGAS